MARVKVVSKIVEAPPAVEEGEETPRHLVLPPLPVQNWTNASVPIEKGLIVAVVCLAREEAPVILLHKQHVVRRKDSKPPCAAPVAETADGTAALCKPSPVSLF